MTHVVPSFVNFLLCSTKRNFLENCTGIVPCFSLNQSRHSINIYMWDNHFPRKFSTHKLEGSVFFYIFKKIRSHIKLFSVLWTNMFFLCLCGFCGLMLWFCWSNFCFWKSNAFQKHRQSVIYCSYLTLPRTSYLSTETISTILLYCDTLWKESVAGSSVRKHRMSLCSG